MVQDSRCSLQRLIWSQFLNFTTYLKVFLNNTWTQSVKGGKLRTQKRYKKVLLFLWLSGCRRQLITFAKNTNARLEYKGGGVMIIIIWVMVKQGYGRGAITLAISIFLSKFQFTMQKRAVLNSN